MESLNNSSIGWMNITDGFPKSNAFFRVKLFTDLPNIILKIMGVVFACSSLFCNVCVLKAIWKIPSKDLKPKALLINVLASDILFPMSYCFYTVIYIIVACGYDDNYGIICLDGARALFEPLTQYAQALSTLMMAFDRIYAIVMPLNYYTLGYSRLAVFGIITTVWIVSVALILPVTLMSWGPGQLQGFCWRMAFGYRWNRIVRFPVTIGVFSTVFLLYVSLFILLKFIRGKRILTSTNIYKVNMKESLSLAMTFFAIHLTSLALFLPGPVFALTNKSLQLTDINMWRIRHYLILLYLSNSTLDPIIVATRIPAIRKVLYQQCGRRKNKPSSRVVSSNTSTTHM